MKRKIIAIAISIVLVFSLLPTVAFAADYTNTGGDGKTYADTDYNALKTFLDTAGNGSKLSGTFSDTRPDLWPGVTWTGTGTPADPCKVQNINWPSKQLTGAISFSGLTSLLTMDVSGNVSGSNGISSIICAGNSVLTTVNASGDTYLNTLNCGNNANLTSLTITSDTGITELDIYSTKLNDTDLATLLSVPTSLQKLSILSCANITTIDLSGHPGLTSLDARDSGLTSLSLNQNPNLTTLLTEGNELYNLNAMISGHSVSLKRAGNGYVFLTYQSGNLSAGALAGSGASFKDWIATGDWSTPVSTNMDYILTLGQPYDIVANFTNGSYVVVYNANGGTLTGAASQTVNAGQKVTKPADPTRSGYTFGGWYAGAALTNLYDFNVAVNHNATLFAKWTQNATPTPTPTAAPTTAPTTAPSTGGGTGSVSVSAGATTLYQGGRTTLTPGVKGGNWSYDKSLVKLVQNADGTATITALKAGTAVIHYSVGWASTDVTLTIGSRSVPQTGQDFTLMYVLIALAACAAASTVFILKKRKTRA